MKRSIPVLLVLVCACSAPESRRDVAPASTELPRISIDLTVAELPRERLGELFGNADPSGSEVGPEFVRRLEDTEGAIEVRPRLLLLDGHRGDMQVGSEENFVERFDFDPEHDIADPVIGTLWEGLRFEAQPAIREDGKGVDVFFRVEISHLARPIAQATVAIPGFDQTVTIQTPELTTHSKQGRVTLRSGRAFAFVLDPEAARAKVVVLGIELPDGDTVPVRDAEAIEIAPR